VNLRLTTSPCFGLVSEEGEEDKIFVEGKLKCGEGLAVDGDFDDFTLSPHSNFFFCSQEDPLIPLYCQRVTKKQIGTIFESYGDVSPWFIGWQRLKDSVGKGFDGCQLTESVQLLLDAVLEGFEDGDLEEFLFGLVFGDHSFTGFEGVGLLDPSLDGGLDDFLDFEECGQVEFAVIAEFLDDEEVEFVEDVFDL
jgi:hypothetical protein